MNDKEKLKCNRIVDVEELDRHPELIRHIENRINSDIGEEVMRRITDNGEFIVRAQIKAEQFMETATANITETVEITRLIRCKDCRFSIDFYQDGDCYCKRPGEPLFYKGESWNGFCDKGKRKGE